MTIEAQIAALNAQGQAEEAAAKFTISQDGWLETNRRLPEPIKKTIGALSIEERVLVGLDVQPVRP